MDAAQWQQGVGFSKQMEEISSNACNINRAIPDKKPKPQEQLPCPRCNSHNTKFCYYNNYSLSQPRYFCKACRRYWTEGGTLRNVPVGGGSRKNKRSTTTSSSASSKINLDLNPSSLAQFSAQNTKNQEGQDLNLAFPFTQRHEHSAPQFLQASTSSNSTPTSALELLRSGISSRPFGNPFTPPMQFSNAIYSTSSSGVQEFIPSMSIPMEGGHESGHESLHGFQVDGARLLFPFVEPKQMSSRTEVDESKGLGIPTEYLNGIFNGRSW